jgi:hypothetical protein
MAAQGVSEAGSSRSPPPKAYTPDVVPTADPLTDKNDVEETEGFDTQTIREAPPPPDVCLYDEQCSTRLMTVINPRPSTTRRYPSHY